MPREPLSSRGWAYGWLRLFGMAGACLVPLLAQAQTYYFTTIAGRAGIAGSVDGTNLAALFYRPSYLVVDPSGAVFVSDTFNSTIRKLTPVGNDWVATTIAGQAGHAGAADGTNGAAQFYSPNGLAFNAAGDLFVADHQNHTIRKAKRQGPDWVVSTIAGFAGMSGTSDGTNSDARFRIPMGIAVDDASRVFVADTANFTIRMVTPVGTEWVTTTIAGYPLNYGFRDGLNQGASFNYPYGMARGPDGALYVSDSGNYAIRQIQSGSKGWSVTTIANTRGIRGADDGSARSATFNSVNGIVADAANNLFLADQGNHTIRKLTWTGHDWDVSTIGGTAGVYGSADGMGTNALFWMPWGVAVDAAGAVYVADAYNHTIRRGVPAITLQVVAVSPGHVAVSWPMSPEGFHLERSGDLASGDWETITNGIAVAGQRYVVTNVTSGAACFYRLKR